MSYLSDLEAKVAEDKQIRIAAIEAEPIPDLREAAAAHLSELRSQIEVEQQEFDAKFATAEVETPAEEAAETPAEESTEAQG